MDQPDQGEHGAQEEAVVEVVDDLDTTEGESDDVAGGRYDIVGAFPKKLE